MNNKFYDKLIEIAETSAKSSQRLDQIDNKLNQIEVRLTCLEAQDKIQNKLLEEHIMGVKIQAQRLDEERQIREKVTTDLNQRLIVLEIVPTFLKIVRKAIIWLTPITAVLYSAFKLFF